MYAFVNIKIASKLSNVVTKLIPLGSEKQKRPRTDLQPVCVTPAKKMNTGTSALTAPVQQHHPVSTSLVCTCAPISRLDSSNVTVRLLRH